MMDHSNNQISSSFIDVVAVEAVSSYNLVQALCSTKASWASADDQDIYVATDSRSAIVLGFRLVTRFCCRSSSTVGGFWDAACTYISAGAMIATVLDSGERFGGA